MLKVNKIKSGERIAYALKEAGITNKQLSEKLEVSLPSISSWRNGKKTPSIENLLEISDLTGFPIEFFLPVIRGLPRN